MQVPGSRLLARVLNGSGALEGTAFDPATPFGPPQGRYRTVHYGVMLANLPEPLRFMDVIAVLGQPKIPIWRNDHLITTTADDTVSLLVATGASDPDAALSGHSIAGDCDVAADGSHLSFGDRLTIDGTHPAYHLSHTAEDVSFDLELTGSSTVTHFARLRGGLYDHWSLLCRYRGTFTVRGDVIPVHGLANLEYARGAAIALPFRFFTYHVLNVDDRTQILMGEVRGPLDAPVQQEVYVRSLDEPSRVHRAGFRFTVDSYEDAARPTPGGRTMRLPRTFSWRVADHDGSELVRVDGVARGDYVYGMAAGFAGSYDYRGTFRGVPIDGIGYVEYIDGR